MLLCTGSGQCYCVVVSVIMYWSVLLCNGQCCGCVICYVLCAGQSYEMKLKRLKEGNDADEQLLKVLVIDRSYLLNSSTFYVYLQLIDIFDFSLKFLLLNIACDQEVLFGWQPGG